MNQLSVADKQTHAQIMQALENIQRDNQVQILFAIESGSRAWGFPSQDSDFDVRFVYIHQPQWYLSIDVDQRRDVIELPINKVLDISGWDIRKALQLFRKSNPPLLEWLDSPITYQSKFGFVDQMRKLAPITYSPIACMHHYFSMLKGNYREYLRGDRVRLKKYFYILRPLLAVLWLERDMGVVPTEFNKLVEGVLSDESLKNEIYKLIERKKIGTELDDQPPILPINEFVDSEIQRLEQAEFAKVAQKIPYEQLNELFRNTLDTVWGDG